MSQFLRHSPPPNRGFLLIIGLIDIIYLIFVWTLLNTDNESYCYSLYNEFPNHLFNINYAVFCYLAASSSLGTCATSPIISADITCHAMVTYDDGKEGTKTVTGHITTQSCDLKKLCATFADRANLKNPRCTDSFCCNKTTQCSKSAGSGQSSSVLDGVSIMLVLSTLVISFAKYM